LRRDTAGRELEIEDAREGIGAVDAGDGDAAARPRLRSPGPRDIEGGGCASAVDAPGVSRERSRGNGLPNRHADVGE